MLRLSLKNLSQQIVLSLILFFTLFILLALTDKLKYNQNTKFKKLKLKIMLLKKSFFTNSAFFSSDWPLSTLAQEIVYNL